MQDETLQPGRGGGLIVLVVEDEFLIAFDIQTMLEGHGHSVLGPAGSIEDALRLLESGQPDVAMLDLNLRGQLVLPVARRLRSLPTGPRCRPRAPVRSRAPRARRWRSRP